MVGPNAIVQESLDEAFSIHSAAVELLKRMNKLSEEIPPGSDSWVAKDGMRRAVGKMGEALTCITAARVQLSYLKELKIRGSEKR